MSARNSLRGVVSAALTDRGPDPVEGSSELTLRERPPGSLASPCYIVIYYYINLSYMPSRGPISRRSAYHTAMRCKICGAEAVVRLRYANTALCREHFVEFFERRVGRTVRKFKMVEGGERIAVAVSGGKDSLAMLYALSSLAEEMGFEIVGITVDLGIERGRYSERSVEAAVRNYERLGVPYEVVRLTDYGFTIDELARARLRPRVCSLCGSVKRYLLNKVARGLGASKLATSHNLDDFLQVVLEHYLFGRAEELAKFYPAIPPAPGMVPRIKPLVETPERDSMAYVLLKGVEYYEGECPYARGATSLDLKRALNTLERDHPGVKFSMFNVYIKNIYPLLSREYADKIGTVRACEICGEPTSARICLFCRIREFVKNRSRGSD